jgi:hypothetical protein
MNFDNLINPKHLNDAIWDIYDWDTRKKSRGGFEIVNGHIMPIHKYGEKSISLENPEILKSFFETQSNWTFDPDSGINGMEGSYVKSGRYKCNGKNLHIVVMKDKQF